MSKIGRKAVDVSKVTVDIQGKKITIKGTGGTVSMELPVLLKARIADKHLFLEPDIDVLSMNHTEARELNRYWGLYRALINNHARGLAKNFETELHINGLGFKAVISGSTLVFTLGYSHKINFVLPQGVLVDIDKTGQRLTVKSTNKEIVGKVCSDIKALRAVEPYKGTGIIEAGEKIFRKAGKTKA